MKMTYKDLNLPNKPLSNYELVDAIDKLGVKHFRGVFMRDNLPDKINKKECGIVNLDDSFSNGTHWVCYFKDNKNCFYFDSYGLQAPLEISKYLNDDYEYNVFQIQKSGVICGHLCLYFLNKMSKGEEFDSVVISLL